MYTITDPRDFTMPLCLPGCCGKDCIYRLPDTAQIEHKCTPYAHAPYTATYTCPHCAREFEREQWRIELFDLAWAAVEAAGEHCESLRSKLRAEKIAWDQYARQWWDGPCKFYAVQSVLFGSN